MFQCVFNLGSLQQIKKCAVFQCVFNLGPLQKAWEEVWWQGHCHEAGAFGMVEECEAPEVQGSEKTSKVRSSELIIVFMAHQLNYPVLRMDGGGPGFEQ